MKFFKKREKGKERKKRKKNKKHIPNTCYLQHGAGAMGQGNPAQPRARGGCSTAPLPSCTPLPGASPQKRAAPSCRYVSPTCLPHFLPPMPVLHNLGTARGTGLICFKKINRPENALPACFYSLIQSESRN